MNSKFNDLIKVKMNFRCTIVLFVQLFFCVQSYAIVHSLNLDYRPPLVPISFNFEIGPEGVKSKGIKFGLKEWSTPIGTFKIASKVDRSGENMSIIFRGGKNVEDHEYIVPFNGELSVFTVRSVTIPKGQKLFTIINEGEHKSIVIELSKLIGESIVIMVTPNIEEKKEGVGINLLSNMFSDNGNIVIKNKVFDSKLFRISIDKLYEIRINKDKPFGQKKLCFINNQGDTDFDISLDFFYNKYDLEDYYYKYISLYNEDIKYTQTTTYTGWVWIVSIITIIALGVYFFIKKHK